MTTFADDILEAQQPSQRPVVDLGNSKRITYVDDILGPDPKPAAPPEDPTKDMAFGELYGAGMGAMFTDKALGVQQRLLELKKRIADPNSDYAKQIDAQLKELNDKAAQKRQIDAALKRRLPAVFGAMAPHVYAAPLFGSGLPAAFGYGFTEGVTEPTVGNEGPILNGLKSGATSAAVQLGGRVLLEQGLGRFANSFRKSGQYPDRAARDKFAKQEGVELTAGDLSQNPGLMRAENWYGSLPFTGRGPQMQRQTEQVLAMLNKRLDSSLPASLRVPTKQEVDKLPVSELRKYFPQDHPIQRLDNAAIKNMSYDQLVAAGMRPRYGGTNEAMVDLVRQGYNREREKSRLAYNAVSELAKDQPPVIMSNLREAALKALDDHPEFFKSLEDRQVMKLLEDLRESTKPRMSTLPDGTTKEIVPGAVALSFDDARKIRSILGNLSRQAEKRLRTGNEKNPQAVGSLKQIYAAATEDMNKWGESLKDPAVAAAYKLANRTFVQGVNRIRQSKVADLLDEGFDPDKAYSALVRPGGRTIIDDALFAMGPEGRQVLEHAILQDLVGHGTKPAFDANRAVMHSADAPRVTAMAQDFAPGQFVNRARLLRDPISAVINDDARYVDFLRTLDLVASTRRAVQAGADPMTGNRLSPIVNIAATKGAALPAGYVANKLNPVARQFVKGKPLLTATTPKNLVNMARMTPPALALSLDDIINAD